MKQGHIDLHDSVTNMYQMSSHRREPKQYVYVHNRFYGKKGDEFLVEKGRLPGVISLSTDWEVDSTAGSFTIVCDNTEGMLTPEYSYGKVPLDQAWRGHLFSPWRGQLVMNNKLEIWFGYGKDIVRDMTGIIDEVVVNSQEETITISGRSMYKLAIDNTCRPYPGHEYTLPFNTMRITDGIGRLMNYAGLRFEGKPIIDEETNELFRVGEPMGVRGETYDEVASALVNSIFYHLREEPDGLIKQIEVPYFSQETNPVFVIDEERHIISLEYSNDDTSLYGTVIIESNKIQDAFSSKFIAEELLLGNRRETIISYPWANTKYKRQLAARAEFTRMLYKARTIDVTMLANPLLQIYDTIRVLEKISLAQWNYHIRSIATDMSANGFTQTLGLTVNTGFEKPGAPPPPQTHLPNVQASTESVMLGIWDNGAVDLDVVTIRLNGENVSSNLILKESAETINLRLKKGRNIVEFIGVSAGRSGNLTASMYVEDANGNLLTPKELILDMPRGTNVGEYGFYRGKKPVRRWVINRV